MSVEKPKGEMLSLMEARIQSQVRQIVMGMLLSVVGRGSTKMGLLVVAVEKVTLVVVEMGLQGGKLSSGVA
jgi:hypothetical protein